MHEFSFVFAAAPSSPPRNVVVMPTNVSGTVRVSWKAPRFPNGDITGKFCKKLQAVFFPF